MSKASQIRQKAQEFLQKGQIDKAAQEYRRLISIESKNPNLYNELGDIYMRASDREQAVQNYEKAAVIYEKVALYNNAVAVCKKILRVNPEKAETMMKLAELRAKQKLDGEAGTFFAQYVEVVLSNPQQLLQKSQKDVDRMLELSPANEAVLAKAIEVFEQLGMKLRMAEIYGKLAAAARERGDAARHAQFSRKVEEIKAGLAPEEAAQVQSDEPAAAAEAAESPVDAGEAAKPPADSDSEPEMGASAPASDEPAAAAESTAEEEAGVDESNRTQGAGAAPVHLDDTARQAVEEAEIVAAMSQGREGFTGGPGVVGSIPERRAAAPAAPEPAAEPPVREATPAVRETPPPARDTAPPAREATPPRVAPGAFCGGADDAGDGLAEEITSDVEKDDLRSHYDLGMAYLEMCLFTESIRDFQIASRCPDLQLSSMEMIGYCFIKSGQPRLAVKQLQNALEIAKRTGADSLGIHYNLGLAFEMLGEPQLAREHFEEVYIVDMSFRDVAEKMKKLAAVS